MDPMILAALLGGGLGLVKGELVDKPAAERQKKVNATMIRYSPWTGMHPSAQQDAAAHYDPLSGVLQGGFAGAGLGANLSKAGYFADAPTPSSPELTAGQMSMNPLVTPAGSLNQETEDFSYGPRRPMSGWSGVGYGNA